MRKKNAHSLKSHPHTHTVSLVHNYYILFSIGNEWTLHTRICHDDYYTIFKIKKYTEIVSACMDKKNATVMILENISAIHSPIFVFSL